MQLFRLSLNFLFIFFFSSCVKTPLTDQQKATEEFPVLTSATIRLNDLDTFETKHLFDYDTNGDLSSIKDEYIIDAPAGYSLSFNTTKVLNTSTALPNATALYEADGRLVKTVSYIKKPNHTLVQQTIVGTPLNYTDEKWLGVDLKGRIVADTATDIHTHEITFYNHFTYDENDNVIKAEHYEKTGSGTFVHSVTNLFTYDQKVNPFSKLQFVDWRFIQTVYFTNFGKNNQLTQTIQNHLTGESIVFRNYSYAYNSNNLPVKRTDADRGIQISFEYNK